MIHKKIFLNDQILSADKVFIPATSSAALYGKGIFTTLAIYDSKPFLWDKHWARLTENAEQLKIDLLAFSSESVSESVAKLIAASKITDARARITFFDESPSRVWDFETDKKTSFLVTTGDFRDVSQAANIIISPFLVSSTSPLAGVKSCNYLENILALEDARAKGFDESVRINERGEVVSACMANIFWIKDEKIFTPHLETGCLNGTTRSFIAEHFTVAQTKADLAELDNADDVFLTSSGIGIQKAAKIETKQFIKASETFVQIKKLYFDFTIKY